MNSSPVKIALIVLSLMSLSCSSYYRQKYDFYHRISDWEGAEKALQSGLVSDPGNPEIHFLLGQAYGHQGKYEEMDGAFRNSVSISSRYADEIDRYREYFVLEQLNRGIELYNRGSYREAAVELDRVGTIRGEETRHHKYLGLCYSRLGELETARDFLVMSVEQDGDLESSIELARVCDRLGDSEKVIEVTEGLLGSDPDRIDLLVLIAAAYEREVRYQEAISTYRRILELEPYDTSARYNLALLLSTTGRKEEAIPVVEELNRLEPENRRLRNTICSLLYDTGQYEESLSCFEEYMESYPDDREALEYMYILSRELERWDEARRIRAELDQEGIPESESGTGDE